MSTTLFCPISYSAMLPFLDDFQQEKLYCISLMLSEKVGSSLFLLSNHSTKHGLLLLKGLFRVKGQPHSLESAHATCHQYCNIHKGKAHFLSIINSWPMGHIQATREKYQDALLLGYQQLEKQVNMRTLKRIHCSQYVIPGKDI